MNLELTLAVLRAMESEGVAYVVFGGVAVNLLGLARATEDLDLFIKPTEDNIARLRVALRSVFSDPEIDGIRAEDLLGEYPAVQYVPPTGHFHVDILTRLGEAFAYDDLQAMRLDVAGVTVSVATPETLIRMKRDTIRLKDKADAAALGRRFGIEVE